MFEIQAKLIEVVQKPYSVNGNEGISYKLRFLVGDEIWAIKSNSEQCSDMKKFDGKTGKAKFEVKARKEDVSLSLANFTEVK